MKNTCCTFLLLITLTTLSAQSSSLVGDWRFAGFDMPEELTAPKKTMLTRFFGKSFITLNEDKTFHAKITPKEERGKYSIKKKQLQLRSTGGEIVNFPFVYPHEDTLLLEMGENEFIVYSRSKEIPVSPAPAETEELSFAPINLDLLLDHTWAFEKMVKTHEGKDPDIASGPFFDEDYVSFKKGGVFEGIHLKSEVVGTWTLEEKGSKLIRTVPGFTTTFWYVVKLNEEELILNQGSEDHKWYYRKKAK